MKYFIPADYGSAYWFEGDTLLSTPIHTTEHFDTETSVEVDPAAFESRTEYETLLHLARQALMGIPAPVLPDAGAVLQEACDLLTDLKASYELPGYINIELHGRDFAFGCSIFDEDFGYDHAPLSDQGTRDGGERFLSRYHNAHELAAWIRECLALHA